VGPLGRPPDLRRGPWKLGRADCPRKLRVGKIALTEGASSKSGERKGEARDNGSIQGDSHAAGPRRCLTEKWQSQVDDSDFGKERGRATWNG